MTLLERNQAVTRVLFEAEPREADLAAIGSRERWLLYREMVRSRLVRTTGSALPRTRDALGEARFEALYARFLAEAPPTTRYLREVASRFADWALPVLRADDDRPPWLPDLLRYEAARWTARYLEPADDPPVVEFAFDRPAVLTPTLRLLDLEWDVSKPPPEGEPYPQRPTVAAVYRDRDHRAAAWVPNATAAALLRVWLTGDFTMTEAVERVTEERGITITQSFLESLSGMLADFLERGLVLGSRP